MEPPSESQEPVSRQAFLQHGLKQVIRQVAESLPDRVLPSLPEVESVVRPPGALPAEAFTETCDPFCDLCLDICPRDAIVKDSLGFPMIIPGSAPCVMCTDVPCTKVCPSGALKPLDDPRDIRIGLAVIEVTQCTAYQGSGCRVCYDACPIPEDAIVIKEKLPVIVADQCTGCGVCVYACPTPGAIAVVPV